MQLLTVASAIAAPGAASLLGVIAVLTIDRPVASRLKGHGGLISAPGTSDRCALPLLPVVSASTRQLALLCLTAGLATFWSRIATFAEECLILA